MESSDSALNESLSSLGYIAWDMIDTSQLSIVQNPMYFQKQEVTCNVSWALTLIKIESLT